MGIVVGRPVAAFEFVAGHSALDFTNTVSWAAEGLSDERLGSYEQLLTWARQARLPINVRLLSKRARVQPRAAIRVLQEAHAVRGELHALFDAQSRAASMPKALVDRVNARLADLLASIELREIRDAGRRHLAWRVRDDRSLNAPIAWIMWEAAALLASHERIKRCANQNCGWLFLDKSRRGNRRWCDMAVCGSRHKARTFYRRHKRHLART